MAVTLIDSVLRKQRAALLAEWQQTLQSATAGQRARISAQDLNSQAEEFLELLSNVTGSGDLSGRGTQAFKAMQAFLDGLSFSRVQQGFSSVETATFIFSFKEPLFRALRREAGGDAEVLAEETWKATQLIDELGLMTVSSYQRSREEVISRQQLEMLELSTPVVKLWEGILALPMIGTLDSARTQIVMESLLQKIVETGSQIAIDRHYRCELTVDTLVAQHLLKTVTAIRLMGADCIISGVRRRP